MQAIAGALQHIHRLTCGERPPRRLSRREQLICAAAFAWAGGRWRHAASLLELSLQERPTDALAVRLLHDMYFFLGDARNLRDGVARVYPHWVPTMPEYGRVAGMLAFGFEETGLYDRAEQLAFHAMHLDPADPWAIHAAAHVMEMTARVDEGKRLLRETREHWEGAELMSHHINWHWSLLNMEDGDLNIAMARFDAERLSGVHPPGRDPVLALVDDTSLLWRADLLLNEALCPPLRNAIKPSAPLPRDLGGEYGRLAPPGAPQGPPASRWADCAARWGPTRALRLNAFNDIHCAMALAASGDVAGAQGVVSAMRATAGQELAGASASPAVSASSYYLLAAGAVAGPMARPIAALATAPSVTLPAGSPPLPPPHEWTPALQAIPHATPDNAAVTLAVGADVAEGMVAAKVGEPDAAVELLLRSRPSWPLLGGSWAQRDVFEQTLVHAAVAAGRLDIAGGLMSERVTLKHASPQSWYLYGSILEAAGERAKGMDAKNRGYVLGIGQGGPSM